jgi:hypothetical protein
VTVPAGPSEDVLLAVRQILELDRTPAPAVVGSDLIGKVDCMASYFIESIFCLSMWLE